MFPAFHPRFRTVAGGLCFAAGLAGVALSAQGIPALQAAAQVDLPRYMGRWYVVARIPHSGEAGEVGAYVEYRLREDGRIDDFYGARDGSFDHELELSEGVAWVIDPASKAHWKEQFTWPFTSDYLVLYVSDDYRYALAGDPSRDYAWILAREPDIPEWTYAGLLARLALQHYQVSRLRRVPQAKEQIGLPGFE
jgi:apolipoprotein D and lipocalin family protein